LIESFPEWLNEAEARGGCTILFDAINQLEGKYVTPLSGMIYIYTKNFFSIWNK
jgi:hypothetical protein